MDLNNSEQIFPELIKDLLSYEEEKYNYVLKTYFTDDAVLTHPILNVQGRENIRKVFRVWTLLNKQPPEIINKDHLVFNQTTTAIVNVRQHLCPRIFPFLHFTVPSVTVLRFREDDNGKSYIYKQEDNWTLEGLIRSIPLINWWYENVVRTMVGNMVTNMGSFLATANIATSQLTISANHINQHGGDAVVQGQNRAIKYGSDLANSVFNRVNFGMKSSRYITNGEATSLET